MQTTATAEPEPNVPRTFPRGNETLLLVEDHPVIRHLLCQMLQQCGYNVLEADNPTDAIPLAEEHAAQVALLVTDVALCPINGKELSDTLRSRHPNMKTIFVSGYPRLHLVREAVLSPDDPMIQKPFAIETVAMAVRSVLDRQPLP
jgi:DNA-binding NtrC family response regulator